MDTTEASVGVSSLGRWGFFDAPITTKGDKKKKKEEGNLGQILLFGMPAAAAAEKAAEAFGDFHYKRTLLPPQPK